MKTACLLIFSLLAFASVSQSAEHERGRGGVLEKLSPKARKALREVYMEMRGCGFGRGAREESRPADGTGRKDGRPEFDE